MLFLRNFQAHDWLEKNLIVYDQMDSGITSHLRTFVTKVIMKIWPQSMISNSDANSVNSLQIKAAV